MPHAVLLGASRGSGYHALLRLLTPDSDWTATLLLRKPEVIETDDLLRTYIEGGRLKIIKGDATEYGDVKRLFEGEKVDVVISSVGGVPQFKGLKGFVNDQPTLCTQAAIVLVRALSEVDYTPPRVIAVSTMGLKEDHHNLPYILQWLYSLLLSHPHEDKYALEYLLQRASSVLPTPEHLPSEEILKPTEYTDLKADFIPEIIVLRPAILWGNGGANEQAKGKEGTRVGKGLTVWTTNRAEVGRVIVEECLPGDDTWVNQLPTIGW